MHIRFFSPLRVADQCTRRLEQLRADGNRRLVWQPISRRVDRRRWIQ